jgi:phenylacetate-coenzyme A ligase PaaK-like adenylate-forming protein
VFKEAVLRCEAKPVCWGPDYRWKELLRLAFDTHANTIIGPPLVVLGLMKLARATATPLYAYDVIIAGDPFAPWMLDGLRKGFDCNTWGCYAVQSGPVIGGFSCSQEAGIHIREDVFSPSLYVEDEEGKRNYGRLYLASSKNPELVFDPGMMALMHQQGCCCGCSEPRVVEVRHLRKDDILREQLDAELLTWSSVLDYQIEYTESGAALELVVFQGEAIPGIAHLIRLRAKE